MTIDIAALNRMLDEFQPTVQKANDTPPDETVVAKGVNDQIANPYGNGYAFLTEGDSLYMQRKLNALNQGERDYVFTKQLQAGTGRGIPVDLGNLAGALGQINDPTVQKALDTTGGAALIRQDLDPFIVSQFVTVFPAWQRIPKVDANGLVHAWDQLTSYGATDSAWVSELGTAVDKTGVYARQTTNIAINLQRRGVSFKQQLAVQAGGMNWDSARLEIQNGLTQMAHDIQKTIFQGNATNSGGTASDELGLYDANAFTGLRYWFNSAVTTATDCVDFSPYLTSSPDNFVNAFNSGITGVTDQVGVPPNIAFLRWSEASQLANQQLSIQRTMDTTEFIPGVEVPAIATAAGKIPLLTVPGDAIGTYSSTAFTGGTKTVADIYMMNDQFLQVPHLGAPMPQIIEIPPGVSGQLTRLYLIWFMGGLAPLSLLHGVKLRANQAAS